MKRLASIKIDGLFGTFDYEINFEKNDGFTILTAPNGFGKSTILKIIRAAAVGNFCFFADLVFKRIEMNFKGTMEDEVRQGYEMESEVPAEPDLRPKETKVLIEKTVLESVLSPELVGTATDMDNEQHYQCSYSVDDFTATFTDDDIQKVINEVVGTIPSLEPIYQSTGANGMCRLWMDKTDSEVLDLAKVFRRYSIMFRKMFPWVGVVVRKLNFAVNYISTNRLYNEQSERNYGGMARFRNRPADGPQGTNQSAHMLKIFSISSDMRTAKIRCVNEQLRTARELESDFVTRVVQSLDSQEKPTTEELRSRITTKINSIRRLETGCIEFGITPGNRMNKMIETNDNSALIVFDNYLDDVKAKMTVFTPLVRKLKIFSAALRSLLDLKEVKIDLSRHSWEGMLEVRSSVTHTVIPLDALSSGEQHLIVLLGRLLFSTEDGEALVMMDEPEISFHPRWQEDFSEVLFKIQNELREGRNAKRQFLIATHSPAFIGDHWDKTVELAKMVKKS
ncbi:AAA family ATPase [Fibrobacter sp. UWEL]|uniref:AAA family ATPase n=1 Tax=Fibrobacter sp. UWEL TaxID=1896209 RepID=UPI0009125F5C|nr:AAA family ATPase [Fibrobacter sp. UWEL]SHK94154.1 Predicted ATP-binding protein involved in virulence [Fibrobacter sp. UWEL]